MSGFALKYLQSTIFISIKQITVRNNCLGKSWSNIIRMTFLYFEVKRNAFQLNYLIKICFAKGLEACLLGGEDHILAPFFLQKHLKNMDFPLSWKPIICAQQLSKADSCSRQKKMQKPSKQHTEEIIH